MQVWSAKERRLALLAAGVLACAGLTCLVVYGTRNSHRAALTSDWLDGYQWVPPYPGAGPETPDWQVTPASVGQGALNAFDPSHQESNVLANSYVFPDYARRSRRMALYQYPTKRMRMVPTNSLWVGSPMKFLPPDGDYPGGSTGIPLDGYLAYETGWANDGPFHGELAPMQEAGIASRARPTSLSIMDPGQEPAPFDDWDLGNQAAQLDRTYDANVWENARQPLTDYNMGKISCNMGSDCHDGTHHGGVHDNGIQIYDNYHTGSIDPSSDKSVNPEY
ncbi:hypothetical protein GUITHDRAFT_166356 [Guillardia theta CCMP2712]|uniref:Uncharacterized protein n=2 Tax=Guillardia theta TaxID=55529 RepID=L1IC74_GUITC|nr:hypothetical protein GUITHDRAFT_166356 [Guillardia theta CCMP2712]EKX33836.1 hypothetical protein GUITHDRAFT_166356 [Guillardia theta CCMP2712]|eukprot:XP_005820816.1 hypothetical protein GUITHDRAFT_166356 [Guillardia theta CCMP2712]